MNWNFEEFKAYLLFEAAHGDMHFSDEEKAYIKSKINEKAYDRILLEFEKDHDFQRVEKIKEAAEFHCASLEKKAELNAQLRELFEVDGNYSTMEINLNLFLKRVIS